MKRKLLLSVMMGFLGLSSLCSQQSKAEILREQFLRSDTDYVMVVAHRGSWRQAPENSIPAIILCVEAGIDMVEVDVRKTADGHLILMHDTTVNRTTTGRGAVEDLTLEEIKSFFLKNVKGDVTDLRVPTLEEAMLAAKDKLLINLDKAYGLMQDVMPILRATGTLRQVILKGSDTPENTVKKIKNLDPELIYMPNIHINASMSPTDDYIRQFIDLLNPPAIEMVFSLSCYRAVDSEFLAEMKSLGVRPWINTLWASQNAGHSDPKPGKKTTQWDWVLKKGFTLIQSDRPFLLVDYLEKEGRRNLD